MNRLYAIVQGKNQVQLMSVALAKLCLTRMAGVVDVIYVNIVTLYVGCVRMGKLAKGGAVVSRPGTRVDGYSLHEQRS
jgi:hypothetical protein